MEDQYQVTIVVTRLLANSWMGVKKSAGKREVLCMHTARCFFTIRKLSTMAEAMNALPSEQMFLKEV